MRAKKTIRGVIVGDSLSREVAKTERLNILTGREWINKGVGGNLISDISYRWFWGIEQQLPSYVLLIVGINDIYNNFIEGDIAAGFTNIINQIKRIGAKGYICSIPYSANESNEQKIRTININNWLSQTCLDNGMVFIDFFTWSINNSNLRDPDTVHFIIPAGYTAISNFIYSRIQNNL